MRGYLDIGLIDTMKDLLVNFVGRGHFFPRSGSLRQDPRQGEAGGAAYPHRCPIRMRRSSRIKRKKHKKRGGQGTRTAAAPS